MPLASKRAYRLERQYLNNKGSLDWYELGLEPFKTLEEAQSFIAEFNRWLALPTIELGTSGMVESGGGEDGRPE